MSRPLREAARSRSWGRYRSALLTYGFTFIAFRILGRLSFGLYRQAVQILTIAAQLGLIGYNYAAMRWVARARAAENPGGVKGAARVALRCSAGASVVVVLLILLFADANRFSLRRQRNRDRSPGLPVACGRVVRATVRDDAGASLLHSGLQDDGTLGYRRQHRSAGGSLPHRPNCSRSWLLCPRREQRGSSCRCGRHLGDQRRLGNGHRRLVSATDADYRGTKGSGRNGVRTHDPLCSSAGGSLAYSACSPSVWAFSFSEPSGRRATSDCSP